MVKFAVTPNAVRHLELKLRPNDLRVALMLLSGGLSSPALCFSLPVHVAILSSGGLYWLFWTGLRSCLASWHSLGLLVVSLVTLCDSVSFAFCRASEHRLM